MERRVASNLPWQGREGEEEELAPKFAASIVVAWAISECMIAPLLLYEVHVCSEGDLDCGSARVRLSASGLSSIASSFGDAVRVDVRETGV